MRFLLTVLLSSVLLAAPALAAGGCKALPDYEALKTALKDARAKDNGGMNNDMWGAVVDRTGKVCAVATTGAKPGDQWPGSRLIAVEKAGTANALSLPGMALSTSNLYAGSQPGGFLYGLNTTNPVSQVAMAKDAPKDYGTKDDPLVGQMLGGVVVFGGGLAMYDKAGMLLGGIGVSGDTSCADHNIAWRTRHALNLDFVPKGAAPDKSDQIIYDFADGKSASGFGQPTCGGTEDSIAKSLPPVQAAGK